MDDGLGGVYCSCMERKRGEPTGMSWVSGIMHYVRMNFYYLFLVLDAPSRVGSLDRDLSGMFT